METPQDNLDGLGDINPPAGENQEQKSDKQAGPLEPEIQRRDAQIAHWREKAEKAEQDLAKLKPASVETPPKGNNPEEWMGPQDPLEIVRLGKVLSGYDETETEFILKNAKVKDFDGIIAAEKDEMVQLAIKSRREKVKKENNIPSPSGSPGGVNQKSPVEIAKMSREEHMAYEKQLAESQKSDGI